MTILFHRSYKYQGLLPVSNPCLLVYCWLCLYFRGGASSSPDSPPSCQHHVTAHPRAGLSAWYGLMGGHQWNVGGATIDCTSDPRGLALALVPYSHHPDGQHWSFLHHLHASLPAWSAEGADSYLLHSGIGDHCYIPAGHLLEGHGDSS